MQAALPNKIAISAAGIIENTTSSLGPMIGQSAVMRRLFSQMRHTARHLRVAVIEGEAGTGKLLAARALHECAGEPALPFVPCPAPRFLESQPSIALVSARPSANPEFSSHAIIRQSAGGMLVLTRIDELSAPQQARLIEFLQWIDHQHMMRALDSIPRQILCLAGQPLRRLVSSGSFRADLANRVSAIRFALPPLRERREDISPLADHFIQQFSLRNGKPLRGLGPLTLPRLVQHLWPGNVRELESMLSAAALSCPGQWIRPIDLPAFSSAPASAPVVAAAVPTADDDPNLDHAIMCHIRHVLARVDGNKFRAAKLLGISRSTLYRLLGTASIPDAS